MAMQQIERPCIGCGAPMLYGLEVWSDQSAPEILPPTGAVAFKGGHICHECGAWVTERLDERRKARSPYTFRYYNGARTCPVSSVESAVAVWEAFIARSGYGVSEAGNGGEVIDTITDSVIATISYNGRIWPVKEH